MVSLRPWNKNDTQQLLVLEVLLKQKDYMRETTRQLCLRAAQQQTGASPVTAVTIGSGSAALVG